MIPVVVDKFPASLMEDCFGHVSYRGIRIDGHEVEPTIDPTAYNIPLLCIVQTRSPSRFIGDL